MALFLTAIINLDWFSSVEDYLGSIVVCSISGLLFAVGVLSPYMPREDLFGWRSLVIVLISGLSFYCAVWSAAELAFEFNPDLEAYITGSLVGAVIVLLPAPLLLRVKYSPRYAILGLIAAIAGGWQFDLFEEAFRFSEVLAFGTWHLMMSITLHFANPDESLRFDN